MRAPRSRSDERFRAEFDLWALRGEDGGASDAAFAERGERFVGLRQRIGGDFRAHARARREGEELLRVARSEIGDRSYDALPPEKFVGEGGDVAHVDAAADDGAALAYGFERSRHEVADGSEDKRGVERFGGCFVRGSRPRCAKLARERLPCRVAAAGEGEDAAALVTGDLRDDVRGGAESVDAEVVGVAGEFEGAVPDEAGAEQRRGGGVVVGVGERIAGALVGDGELGVAAVDVVAREAGAVAEVLVAAAAVVAGAAPPGEPGDADAG